MRIALLLSLTFLCSGVTLAQDIRYISDKQFVPLRSGAGNEYRIVHKGIPSGTRMTVGRASADGVWSEITTERGTSGWIRTQYLMQAVPAQRQLTAAQEQSEKAKEKSTALAAQVKNLKAERAELKGQITSGGSELDAVSSELTHLKHVSGKAVQLDVDNRRLVENTENLRSEVEMLESENQRLLDKLESEDFLNGALAVLLGVIIALVAPRLIPKRRKNSSWA
ncbi:MAG: SH3 domain protein [Halioglobus sp.]